MPPMHTPSDSTLDALYAALYYDPEIGELVWLKSSPRISEGTPAGTLNRAGRLVVGFQGKKYPAGAIAWFIHRDGHEWPRFPIVFKDGNPTNLADDNLLLAPHKYSHNPKAQQMRVYRARAKERKVAMRPRSELDTVNLCADGKTWSVRADHDLSLVIGEFDNLAAAEAFSRAAVVSYRYVKAHPPETDLLIVRAGEHADVLTLAEAHNFFAYDPDQGNIYYRWTPVREGLSAIQLNDRNRPFVRASGRQYPAGMMAWFLANKVWPARKQIAYHDGNPRNIKLDNLYLKGAQ